MIFGLFKKHCVVCGVEVKKESSISLFGKHLCSQEHADEYKKKIVEEEARKPRKGGCCG